MPRRPGEVTPKHDGRRAVGELVSDRAVDERQLHSRLSWGEDELLLAHRLGLFLKPRISGHVKRSSMLTG
jgi:hypothetical protein